MSKVKLAPSRGAETIRLLLDEEYGYRSWVWDSGMSAKELISWWKNLHSVMIGFFDPRKLPGSFMEIEDKVFDQLDVDPRWWRGHIHTDEDSFIRAPIAEGHTLYRHAGYRRK